MPVLESPTTGLSLLQFLVFSYTLLPISGQLVNSDTSESWQWPISSFLSSVKSDSSSPLSLESQPNSDPSLPGDTPLFFPAYNPAATSGQREDFSNLDLHSKTSYPLPFYLQSSSGQSLSPNKQSLSSIQNGDQSYKFPLVPQPEILSPAGLGFSPPSGLPTIPNQQNHQPLLLSPVPSGIFVDSNPLNYPLIQPLGLNAQLKLSPEPSSPFSFPSNDDSVLFPPKLSSPNFRPSISGITHDFLPHKSLVSPEPLTPGSILPLPKYLPGDFDSSHLLSGPLLFPDSSDVARFTSPPPFETVPQISPPYSSEFFLGSSDYLLKPSPFSLSSASSVSVSPSLTSLSGFPDYFVKTSFKPHSSLNHMLLFPQDQSFDSSLPLPKVSGPITQSPEAIPQEMPPYEPELPLNYEPSFSEIPSFPAFDSSGSLDSSNVQSEPSDFFNPDLASEQPSVSQPSLDFPNLSDEESEPSDFFNPDLVSEQPSVSQPSLDFPNLSNEEPESSDFFDLDLVSEQPSVSQPSSDFPNLSNEEPEPSSAETVSSAVNEESADQPAVINGSSEFPHSSECPANERFLKCGSSCPRTCQNFIQYVRCDKKECKSGCFCKKGLLRNKYGECVKFRRCNPVICRRHEVFRSCGPACETKCGNYSKNSTCSNDECVRGCFCRNGLIRHRDGICVKPEHCEIVICRRHEVFRSCGPACETKCENYGKNSTCSSDECVRGCFCRNGLVRRRDGRCVKPEHCEIGPKANKEAINSSPQDSSDITYDGSSTNSGTGSEGNSNDSSSVPSTAGSETDSEVSSKANSSDSSSAPSTTCSETDSDVSSDADSNASSSTSSAESSDNSSELPAENPSEP